MMSLETQLKSIIREVPDWPVEGVNFKDISPVLLEPVLLRQVVQFFSKHWTGKKVNRVLGIESRGFLFGPSIAAELDAGFLLVRKKGKLPPETDAIEYDLEYGSATIEIIKNYVKKGDRVLIHDDLIATGGTAEAAAKLVKGLGAEVVGFCFLVELGFLGGIERLKGVAEDAEIQALVRY